MTNTPTDNWLDEVKWNQEGLVPAVAQEWDAGDVLMLAWMNRDALRLTVETGRAVYWSRSRGRLWHKGEESGHRQLVKELRLDCDNDTVLLRVEQVGGVACHTGRRSCFFRKLDDGGWRMAYGGGPGNGLRKAGAVMAGAMDLNDLAALLEERKGADPDASYVARLHGQGLDAILKKVAEESFEVAMAAKDGDREHLVYETADLWFHTLVLLSHEGLAPGDVLDELARRFGTSGIEEKARRNKRGGF